MFPDQILLADVAAVGQVLQGPAVDPRDAGAVEENRLGEGDAAGDNLHRGPARYVGIARRRAEEVALCTCTMPWLMKRSRRCSCAPRPSGVTARISVLPPVLVKRPGAADGVVEGGGRGVGDIERVVGVGVGNAKIAATQGDGVRGHGSAVVEGTRLKFGLV